MLIQQLHIAGTILNKVRGMCTASLYREHGRLLLTFNRDELRTRAPEINPTIRKSLIEGGPDWLAPLDGTAGGTWIAINTLGRIACLMNGYLEKTPSESDQRKDHLMKPSRGEIIPLLMSLRKDQSASEWLERNLNVRQYASFRLLVIEGTAAHY